VKPDCGKLPRVVEGHDTILPEWCRCQLVITESTLGSPGFGVGALGTNGVNLASLLVEMWILEQKLETRAGFRFPDSQVR